MDMGCEPSLFKRSFRLISTDCSSVLIFFWEWKLISFIPSSDAWSCKHFKIADRCFITFGPTYRLDTKFPRFQFRREGDLQAAVESYLFHSGCLHSEAKSSVRMWRHLRCSWWNTFLFRFRTSTFWNTTFWGTKILELKCPEAQIFCTTIANEGNGDLCIHKHKWDGRLQMQLRTVQINSFWQKNAKDVYKFQNCFSYFLRMSKCTHA